MSKTLVVVESPAKAKTIGKFLGKKYVVKASMGHIRDLPKSQFGINLENDVEIKYITIRGKGDLLQELKTLARKCDHVLLATDPDREGEAIAWHLQAMLNVEGSQHCRIEFHEVTQKAIGDAVRNPRPIDINRVEAQQARRVLDRVVGYNLSPLLWRKVKKGLSAGRVQSVAVRLICDREEEIVNFIPQEYWTLGAQLNKDRKTFEAKLATVGKKKAELKNQDMVEKIIQDIGKADFTVGSVKKRKQARNPAPPFITSSLQQEAYRKCNFSAKITMMIAQQLYEGLDLSKEEGTVGLVTYIRTDSTRISDEAKAQAKTFIEAVYGAKYYPQKARVYTVKGKIQNAHEGIRPTSVERTPESVKTFLSTDQYKLYKLVWDRFVASQMASAELEVTTADIKVKDYGFRAAGVVMLFPGFTKLYTEGRDGQEDEEQGVLPVLTEGESLTLKQLLPKQHFTQPLPRFTEATLIKSLEEMGVGRPSTYAPILDTILSRGYVYKEKKQYGPTELGLLVMELLKKYFSDVIDYEFTAQMETLLDKVEEGEQDWKKVILEFNEPFIQELKVADEEIGPMEIADEVTDVICDKCGRNMVVKRGRFGKFLACPGFPECRNTKPLLEELGVPCPKCGRGKAVARWSKKGKKFFGCSLYPECDFVSWDEPSAEKCPQCGAVLMIKNTRRDGRKLVCPTEKCGFSKIQEAEQDA
ncbi:MAG: type I DNA topoisomerase [Peptococcaceae bacterium]|jgi:DNA topoisomerase-1|nr:type I DNA topoisomerase [Peptococcaceae bacterium]